MNLDHDICYRALRTRDRRFDGRFFTGVTSTGIYCRPICPARTPRAANCTFFACAAAAEEAGFRPCLRCRPETAPGTPAWSGTSATVNRALRLIDTGTLDTNGVEDLAARLGVGDRHLRRLFAEHLGASPLAVAHTRRAHFAKQLIEETELPMGQLALAAGFQNVRRFNAAVRQVFHRSPTEIRAAARRPEASIDGAIVLRLAYRKPLDWDGLLDFVRPRAIPGVEVVTDTAYRRTTEWGPITIDCDPAGRFLRLHAPVAAAPHLSDLVERARRLFDLDADPVVIADQLSADPYLATALGRCPGVRVLGAWDRFETAVRGILGQQVTVVGATRLAGRLVERFGKPITGDPGHLFPSPADFVDADIASIGMPGARAETIRALARAVRDGEPVLEPTNDLDTAVARLAALPGIGDWTAQYIAMRCLHEPDAFPAGDLGLRKALGDGDGPATPAVVRRRAEGWRPWRAYAAMLLWGELSGPGKRNQT